MNSRVYFDNAATTQMHPDVITEMVEIMKNNYGNPSSTHDEGRKMRARIENARKRIAAHFNASIGEIFFTSGGTESSNMALKCSVRDLGVKRIISSPTEHHCVLHCLEILEKQGIEVIYLNVDEKGRVNMNQLKALLSAGEVKTMVSLMHANNEIGTMIDLKEVADMCHEHNAIFHSDTVQTVGHYPIDVSEIKIGFFTGGAHKFHGPKGVGFIYINSENQIAPYLDGGAQERNMRGGTENVYGIVGMAKALDLAYEELADDIRDIKKVKSYLLNRLQETFDDIQLNGTGIDESLYTVLNVSFPPSEKNDMLLMALDIHGIAASGGSACSSGAEQGSHVLEAIGAAPDRKSVRFSFSKFNTLEDVETLIEKLKMVIPAKAAV